MEIEGATCALEGVVLRKKASLPAKREEMLFVSYCRLILLLFLCYTASRTAFQKKVMQKWEYEYRKNQGGQQLAARLGIR
ncbi:MAG: hypothetical protein IJX37_06305 [Oscillospiraceae bacterium]|nr:hypothetical protein [Oscillospiraceae bacterium]